MLAVFVTDLVHEALEKPTIKNTALTPEMKVTITLRYLATGKMQLCSGDDLGVSQPTVSRVISEMILAPSDNDVTIHKISRHTTGDINKKNGVFFLLNKTNKFVVFFF